MKEHTSLELSKRLHDKGFRAEHHNIWIHKIASKEFEILHNRTTSGIIAYAIPAYTFTELWGVVPHKIVNGKYHIEILKVDDGIHTTMGYIDNVGNNFMMNFFHESPAEALGLLVEWLIDEGHIQCDRMEG